MSGIEEKGDEEFEGQEDSKPLFSPSYKKRGREGGRLIFKFCYYKAALGGVHGGMGFIRCSFIVEAGWGSGRAWCIF